MKPTENLTWTTLNRSFKQSFSNVARNGLLSIGITAVIAIIVFIFNILLIVNFTATSAINDLTSKVDFVIYLNSEVGQYEGTQLATEIKLLPDIKEATFISKADAFSSFKKLHPETADFFEKYNLSNPLPPSIHVIADNPEVYPQLDQYVRNSKYKNLLENVVEQSNDTNIIKKVSENLGKISTFTTNIIFWVILMFVLGSALIINNVIHITIYSRRTELTIMRLVGAKSLFIKLPFIMESCWYAIGATVVGFLFTMIASSSIGGFAIFSQSAISLPLLLLLEILCAIAIAVLACLWSIQRHIKKNFLK